MITVDPETPAKTSLVPIAGTSNADPYSKCWQLTLGRGHQLNKDEQSII